MTNSKLNKSEKKNVNIGTNVSLNGLVTAVFDNMVHVQIGAKIVTVQMKDLLNGTILQTQQTKTPSQ
ncbi:MAG: hypothetical protein AB2374_15885 [Cytobacillus gottheilii]|uniref:DUF2187 domain-containing protein n=3 Tax=Cytobacillus gottheilii TaxID=859144 RepID=A0ABX8FI34_9BACI|nr:hypothetical protein [Cytobacillus gottheilii]QVY63679.1 hypothetical protein J1899_06510 [Cytobacillus gottheilii]